MEENMALHAAKNQQPFSQKLRTIQLFEGNLNGRLKYLLGRLLMRHDTKEETFDSDTYGSRTEKNSFRSSCEFTINI